ncbi:hypothetical protein Tco_0122282 [Tanacetum coccineum]
MEKRLSLMDVMVPLAEPLSSQSLIGEASTSAAPATAEPITTISITFESFGVVPPLSISDYQVLDPEPHDEDPPVTTFEEKELDTIPKMFSLRSLSLYAPLPNAFVTSYGPSHLGPSLPPSSAWLISLSGRRVLKVGMPISTGITACVPYVSENGVSPLLDLIIVRAIRERSGYVNPPLVKWSWRCDGGQDQLRVPWYGAVNLAAIAFPYQFRSVCVHSWPVIP